MSRDNDQKRKENPYMEVSRDTDAYKSSDLQLSNHCSTFILKNQLASFSYQHSNLFTHGLQHYKKLWTNWLAPTMWTLASVKTDLDYFLGPKMTPTTWILTQKCSREKIKMQIFD